MRQIILAILALATAGAAPVHAQQHGSMPPAKAPRGLVLNAHAFAMPGFSIDGPDVDTPIDISSGPGAGAQVGYAFSPRYMIYAGADLGRLGAAAEDGGGHWGLGMLELGGRMSFPKAASRLTPYVTGAVGLRGLGAKVADFGTVKLHGMALSGGGGITYALSPNTSLNAAAVVTMGKFGHYEDPGQSFDVNVNNTLSTRLQFGLDWRP
jgi:hypothetical protein